ncbi:MAG TPA: histidinol dehydrogenase [Planctomycetota bacterium]|nr:histidinol dehydrogenase [Planctomycetota bacterium]
MKTKSVIPVIKAGTPAAASAVRKLSSRLAALERIDHTAFRARTKKAFGREMLPDEVVSTILNDVREHGDKALLDYAQRLDGVKLTPRTLRVTDSERARAYKRTDSRVRKALELSARRIADYQQRLMPRDVPSAPFAGASGHAEGVKTGMVWDPLQRAGLYIPAGTAPLFSTVLMIAVPAQVAGVQELALTTPCGKDGAVNDGILCACEILGLKEIYKLGGAQAIAALAFGTKTVRAVDKIAGPGNLFVMLAKRAVFGHVDIDMLAGPSEVLIIADGSANPAFVAADLLAQAEHDVLASCVLLTDNEKLASAVATELARQLEALPRKEIAATALRDWGMILITRDEEQSVMLANALAPEHLEVMTKKPQALTRKLKTAGAIFVGAHATEPLGDYIAGPSHALPTGGTARAFSGVSVYTFLRRTSIIEADSEGLGELAEAIEVLAAAEGLAGHERAVAVRRSR